MCHRAAEIPACGERVLVRARGWGSCAGNGLGLTIVFKKLEWPTTTRHGSGRADISALNIFIRSSTACLGSLRGSSSPGGGLLGMPAGLYHHSPSSVSFASTNDQSIRLSVNCSLSPSTVEPTSHMVSRCSAASG